jgi:hypothetical protein
MFKKGDKVICIKKEFSNETVNKIYTVLCTMKTHHSDLDLGIEKDDRGYENYYRSENFKLFTYLEDFDALLK